MKYGMEPPKYIEPEDLAGLLEKKDNKTTVLDVRDGDFAGGNIAGARNEPSESLEDFRLSELAHELKGQERVVFHCMFSQVRGPKFAQRFARVLHEENITEGPEVLILRGGWRGFANRFGAVKPQLLEGYDASMQEFYD